MAGGDSDLGISGGGRPAASDGLHAAEWVRPPRVAGGTSSSEASTQTPAGGADTVAAGRVAVAGRCRHCHGRHWVQGGQALGSAADALASLEPRRWRVVRQRDQLDVADRQLPAEEGT